MASDMREDDETETVTIEAIQQDPWNAVMLDLPPNPNDELLTAARDAVAQCIEDKLSEFQKSSTVELGMDTGFNAACDRADRLDNIANLRAWEREQALVAMPLHQVGMD